MELEIILHVIVQAGGNVPDAVKRVITLKLAPILGGAAVAEAILMMFEIAQRENNRMVLII